MNFTNSGLIYVTGGGNSYTGAGTLSGGTLQFGSPTVALGSLGTIGNITTAPGAVVNLTGSSAGGGFLVGQYGTVNLGIGGSGTVNFNNTGAAAWTEMTMGPSFAGTLNVGPNDAIIISSGTALGNPALVNIPAGSGLILSWYNGDSGNNLPVTINFPIQIGGTGTAAAAPSSFPIPAASP